MFTNFVLQMQARYKAIKPFLDRYKDPPDGAAVPARNLTQNQARDLVIHHFANQDLSLEPWPEFDTQGKLISPKVGARVRLHYTISGVQYVANNPDARSWELTKPLDQRLVVLLVRVSQWLKAEWGASVIYWGGLGTGRSETDQHGKGYAMDFHGALTQYGDFNVWRDWGAKPVSAKIGGRYGQWPPTTTKTSYRLALDPLDLYQLVTTSLAPEFFQDFYNFLTTQASHRSNETTPRIGQLSSILHPDTLDPRLRPGHVDHIHMEIDR